MPKIIYKEFKLSDASMVLVSKCNDIITEYQAQGFVLTLRQLYYQLVSRDPSGKDMTRDISDRMQMFMGGTKLERLALNMEQVEKYDPPPNPAKLTDSRCQAYIAEFGDESWELDALEPSVIAALIRSNVMALINKKLFKARLAERTKHRETLKAAAERWGEVEELIAS